MTQNHVIEKLHTILRYPRAFATSREALLAQVCILLDLLEPNHAEPKSVAFYASHLERQGNSYVGLTEPLDDAWIERVRDHALDVSATLTRSVP